MAENESHSEEEILNPRKEFQYNIQSWNKKQEWYVQIWSKVKT